VNRKCRFWIFKLELVEILEKEYLSLVLGLAQFNRTGPSPGLELVVATQPMAMAPSMCAPGAKLTAPTSPCPHRFPPQPHHLVACPRRTASTSPHPCACVAFASRRSSTTSPPRSPPRLSFVPPHADELSKKVPQAPRALPPRVVGLCSSQATSPKTARSHCAAPFLCRRLFSDSRPPWPPPTSPSPLQDLHRPHVPS
jgi:hypothetical protein